MTETGTWNSQPCAVLRRSIGTDGQRLVTIQTNLGSPVQRILTIPESTYTKAQTRANPQQRQEQSK